MVVRSNASVVFPPLAQALPDAIPDDLIVTMRKANEGGFTGEVGDTLFLKVKQPYPPYESGPPNQLLKPNVPKLTDPGTTTVLTSDAWFDAVIQQATRMGPAAGAGARVTGDVLLFIHGYSNDPNIVMQRHGQLRKDLDARGYTGAVVSFDWPCGNQMAGYLSDRAKAHQVAPRFVDDLIKPFVARVRLNPNCAVNVHVLAHSTGAYLFQEAVDQSDERRSTSEVAWSVSQLILIGADIDQPAMSAGHGDGESMLRHAIRVTNYSNPYDEVLKLSNVKRLGLSPRIGRVGLPADAPAHAVNVNCGAYYHDMRVAGAAPCYGYDSHSWHIGDPVWADDLLLTIQDDWDRHVLPTRQVGDDGTVALIRP